MNADETILWIKKQLTDDTPLRAMYQTNKTDLLISWAQALESKIVERTLKIEINQISNHIRQELLSINLDSAVHHMHHIMPKKYTKNSAHYNLDEEFLIPLPNSSENSSASNPDFTEENSKLFNITKNIKDSITILEELLRTTPIETSCEKKYLDEVNNMSHVVMEKAKFCTDGREKVSRLDHVLSLQLSTTCTLNSIYDTLTALKMQQATITSKQMGKIVSLKIKDAYETLRPRTEQQAIQQGWSGITCDECAEFRVTREYNSDSHDFMDHCVTCDNWQKMKLSPVISSN